MTVQDLLTKSLKKLGNTSPTPAQYESALESLNFALNSVVYWDDSVIPVLEYDAMSDVVNLPYKYVEALIYMVAANEAFDYGQDPSIYMTVAITLQNRVDYPSGQAVGVSPVVLEVI